jgi:hypothetical protein
LWVGKIFKLTYHFWPIRQFIKITVIRSWNDMKSAFTGFLACFYFRCSLTPQLRPGASENLKKISKGPKQKQVNPFIKTNCMGNMNRKGGRAGRLTRKDWITKNYFWLEIKLYLTATGHGNSFCLVIWN